MRLPSLNALRAFEASARHGSFVRASDELHVSPGAISRHIKLLEGELNVQLFRRLPSGLELTPAAHNLLPRVSSAFEILSEGIEAVSSTAKELKIIAASTIVNRWLIPSLSDFQRLHPELIVNIGILKSNYDEFFAGAYDAGIATYQTDLDRPQDVETIFLRREFLTPVCAPSFLTGQKPISTPEDLKGHLLLHTSDDFCDWRIWLDAAGLSGEIDHRQGQVYETMDMALRAAVSGLGVTIADLPFVREELAAGTLVTPFDFVASDHTGYVFFCKRGRSNEPHIRAFRNWVLSKAETDGT